MTNPTSNYGWQMPTATDLVTDLPADFEVFGQAVDTALMDLKGGTTGQVLAKASGTDMDFVWSTDASGMTNPMTTTGDIIYSSSGSTPARLAIGSAGQVLTVAGGIPSYATPSSGSLTSLATGTLSTGSLNVSGLSGAYKGLKIIVTSATFANAGFGCRLRLNNDSSAIYTQSIAFAWVSNTTPSNTEIPWMQGGTSSNKNVGVCDIWDYASTTHWKFVQYYSLSEGSTGGNVNIRGGTQGYNSTSAISAITFFADGDTFTGGTYTIYGVN